MAMDAAAGSSDPTKEHPMKNGKATKKADPKAAEKKSELVDELVKDEVKTLRIKSRVRAGDPVGFECCRTLH
jgi:hypothetical protein